LGVLAVGVQAFPHGCQGGIDDGRWAGLDQIEALAVTFDPREREEVLHQAR
jgi:hypothetical protein